MSKRYKKRIASLWMGYCRCGKGTQTEALNRLGHPVFETGNALKRAAKERPLDRKYDAIRRGELVEADTVVWTAKSWLVDQIMVRKSPESIHFDAIPRNIPQLPILDFLLERKYDVRVVWFTTSPDVCDARPPREDRFEDTDPGVIRTRRQIYQNETLPLLSIFQETYGIREQEGNLLLIDNEHLTKWQTASQIIEFLDLPFTPAQMFNENVPAANGHSKFHSNLHLLTQPGGPQSIPALRIQGAV